MGSSCIIIFTFQFIIEKILKIKNQYLQLIVIPVKIKEILMKKHTVVKLEVIYTTKNSFPVELPI